MRTFEYRDAKSQKYWNIDLQGDRFTVTFGRIGTAGQTQTKEFPDAARAQAAHDKLVREKLGKGYVETSAAAPAAGPAPTALALERALVDDPDNLTAHAAYADYLTEQGDPRGEFIQVQLALEDAGRPARERKKLQEREQALLEQHGRQWLGDLAPYLLEQRRRAPRPAPPPPVDPAREAFDRLFKPEESEVRPEPEPIVELPCRFRFARGWLDTLEVDMLSVAFARVLARAPQTRLLRRLVIKQTRSIDDELEDETYTPGRDVPEGAYYPGLFPLLTSPHLGNVRVFQLGELAEHWPFESTWTSGEGAADLVRKMPRLEELYCLAHAGRDDLTTLFGLESLTHLRILQVYHVEAEYPLATLAGNPALVCLTHLLLHPHGYSGSERGSYLPREEVGACVRSPHLKSLTHLRLHLSNLGDEGCTAIVRSGILKRLKLLDLRHGCVTDEGARTLTACPDLHNLELLDLTDNALTREGVAALRDVGIHVELEEQHATNDDWEYLSWGDME